MATTRVRRRRSVQMVPPPVGLRRRRSGRCLSHRSQSVQRPAFGQPTGGGMADVSAKAPTLRTAVARCELAMKPRTLATIKAGKLPKGDVWATAQVAGILASKRTAELIPLCHPIPVSHVDLRGSLHDKGFVIEAAVTTTAPTGPEMEALTAAAMAALTVYDMCKSIERGITIQRLCLVSKSGGKSGVWSHHLRRLAAGKPRSQ